MYTGAAGHVIIQDEVERHESRDIFQNTKTQQTRSKIAMDLAPCSTLGKEKRILGCDEDPVWDKLIRKELSISGEETTDKHMAVRRQEHTRLKAA